MFWSSRLSDARGIKYKASADTSGDEKRRQLLVTSDVIGTPAVISSHNQGLSYVDEIAATIKVSGSEITSGIELCSCTSISNGKSTGLKNGAMLAAWRVARLTGRKIKARISCIWRWSVSCIRVASRRALARARAVVHVYVLSSSNPRSTKPRGERAREHVRYR